MEIDEQRFKAILAGTALGLSSKELTIRSAAFDAEKRGEDPAHAVQQAMPDVTIVRRKTLTGAIPPVSELLENARKQQPISSKAMPRLTNQPPSILEKGSTTSLRPVAHRLASGLTRGVMWSEEALYTKPETEKWRLALRWTAVPFASIVAFIIVIIISTASIALINSLSGALSYGSLGWMLADLGTSFIAASALVAGAVKFAPSKKKEVSIVAITIAAMILAFGAAVAYYQSDWFRLIGSISSVAGLFASQKLTEFLPVLSLKGVFNRAKGAVAGLAQSLSIFIFVLMVIIGAPFVFILSVVDTWQGQSAVVWKLLISLTLDVFLAAIWPVTLAVWSFMYFDRHHSPLNLLF